MRSFRRSRWMRGAVLMAVGTLAVVTVRASAFPEWLEHVVAGSPVEAALYRAMALPGVQVLFPRPPAESAREFDLLIAADKENVALYSLRAQQKEQSLDFSGAASDWKTYAARASDRAQGLTALADFYSRRHDADAEFEALLQLITLPANAREEYSQLSGQSAWMAAERALTLTDRQALAAARTEDLWQKWISRYPQQSSIYVRAFQWELREGRTSQAEAIRVRYRTTFPQDEASSLKMAALLVLHGNEADGQEKALAVYDAAFQPLWPANLVSGYFDLLGTTHHERRFLADAQARLRSNPDDIGAAARIFLYYQRQQRRELALATLEAYRQSKDTRHAAWSPDELNVCAYLATMAGAYPEAARYSFALAHTNGKLSDGREARDEGLAQLIYALLSAPDQQIALGSGNLSMYRDIATLDQGPGYWNGILSLWLNSESPSSEFDTQQAKAQSYFHRAKAVELLHLLDRDAPNSPDRAELHRKLVDVYAAYGDDDAVLHEGAEFLASFSTAAERVPVALTMADVYARRDNTEAEFALYDNLLRELATAAKNMPLSAASPTVGGTQSMPAAESIEAERPISPKTAAFVLEPGTPSVAVPQQAFAYSEILERYLGRLTSMGQQPRALAMLRRELDRNPNNPRLYERLADFLQANNFADQTVEVYRQALEKFKDNSWYDKMARLYLRVRRQQDYAALTRKVTDIFSGTELDHWFSQPMGQEPQFALQLNQYAHQRFPHDLVFTDNLLNLYRAKPTRDDVAWEALMRQVWWQSPALTQQFFAWMSATGKLDAEVARLDTTRGNPAATLELAEVDEWRSHFEEAAPLFASLSEVYPANETLGTTASDLQRSLAWLDPSGPSERIGRSVEIEKRLLASHPADINRLARIGDILADHADGSAAGLKASAAYWNRMPETAPGETDSYLQSATVFWDYFQYDDAMKQLRKGRERFHKPDLDAYEAGAIAEGKGDEALAVQEYLAAVMADGSGQARMRLLQLARRKEWAGLADKATEQAANANAEIAAIQLRVDVLEALGRKTEAPSVVSAAVSRSTRFETVEAIAQYAQSKSFTDAYEAAVGREVDLAQDPMQRLQLRYALAQSHETRGDTAGAAKLMDAVYQENPKRLGVVRSTVDFDLRMHQPDKAIKVLLDAAANAYPVLSQQLMAEAASRLNETGNHARAREIAIQLLEKNPASGPYLWLAIDSYSGDDSGRKQFFQQQLDAIKAASLATNERKARTATLRKAMLPALTQGKRYDDAVDQYIALLSDYPEDASLVNEAALYALRYGRQQQLLAFYIETNRASPKDSRFFIDCALTETAFGDPAAAVDSYSHVVAIRKDRTDVYTAKASLEESLQRFDDAAGDYSRLYQLTYHDPQWMVAAARVRARQGRSAEAVAAIQTAWLHGSQSTPHDFFQIAAQLESWNLIDEAKQFVLEGAAAAGDSLLLPDGRRVLEEDPVTYARVLARCRLAQDGVGTLRKNMAAANVNPSSPSVIAEQVKAQGVLSVTDADWRKHFVEQRQRQAREHFRAALQAASTVVAAYYTPEEKLAYADLLTHERIGASADDRNQLWIAAAHTAHLSELEEKWRREELTAHGATLSDEAATGIPSYSNLQRRRMMLNQLGQTLEEMVVSVKPNGKFQVLALAAQAYGDGGDARNQLRILRQEAKRTDAGISDEYLELLLQQDKAAFIAEAAGAAARADGTVNYALQHAPKEIVYAALEARSHHMPAVWGNSYRALSGLYLRDTDPATGSAFRSSLALERTIGERLGVKLDSNRELAGKRWFYQAARYGTWRAMASSEDVEETVAADLEAVASADNYVALANTYAEAGNAEAALVEIGHALELEPTSASLYDARALLLWKLNQREKAEDAWKKAFLCLQNLQDAGPAPETFWTDFRVISQHIASRGIFETMKPSMEGVLRPYVRRNGSYRVVELLRPAMDAVPSPEEATSWLLSLASASTDEAHLLNTVDSLPWLSPGSREAVALREFALSQSAAASYLRQGAEKRILEVLLEQNRDRETVAFLERLPAAERDTDVVRRAEAILAGRMGAVDQLLTHYSNQPETAASSSVLQAAAQELAMEHKLAPAIELLQFDLRDAESRHAATATQYLALADLQLQANDVAGAMTFLQRMVRVSADSYADADTAAALLETHNRPADALPFLQMIAGSVPWKPDYRVRLAEAMQKAGKDGVSTLAGVAKDPQADYGLRVRAAKDLADANGGTSTSLNGRELEIIATHHTDEASASQPMFVAAREIAAYAAKTPEARERLFLQALATDPEDLRSSDVRISLFRFYVETKQIAKARGALNVMLEPQGESFLPANDIVLDTQIADIYLATGERQRAMYFLEKIVSTPDHGAAATAQRKIAEIRRQQRLDGLNRTRRPLVREALDQSVIVRARLENIPPDIPEAYEPVGLQQTVSDMEEQP